MKRWVYLAFLFTLIALSGVSSGKYSGGTGSPSDPYRIATPNDLNDIGNHVEDFNKHFIMVNDINLAEFTGTQFNIIGNDGNEFTGVFDGNGNQISKFTYDSSEENVGLWGVLDGEIKNLGMIDPNIRAEGRIGSLVGLAEGGTISNCYVEGGFVRGTWQAGGLIGVNDDGGSIVNCHSIGNVSGNYDVGGLIAYNRGTVVRCCAIGNISGVLWVGGLVGSNNSEGTLIECYSLGSVSGGAMLGGLAGENNLYYSKIINCYSRSTVDGSSDKVGGLVGENLGEIINSYSTGLVTSTGTEIGGLVGNDFWSDMGASWWGVTVDSFWDTETSGQSSSAGGTGKTTSEMQQRSTFADAGWDMVEVWDIGENQTYPFLRKHLPSDINKDGETDFYDFAILAEHWLGQ